VNRNAIPDLDTFIAQVEGALGRSLNQPEKVATEDFRENLNTINSGVTSRSVTLHVDAPVLYERIPGYSPYHRIKDIGDGLIIIAILLAYFFWQVAVILAVIGFSLHKIADQVRDGDVRRFIKQLLNDISQKPFESGLARLCAYYVNGIVLMMSGANSSHWPQYPSNMFTGQRKYIEHARRIEIPQRKYLSFLLRRIKHH